MAAYEKRERTSEKTMKQKKKDGRMYNESKVGRNRKRNGVTVLLWGNGNGFTKENLV